MQDLYDSNRTTYMNDMILLYTMSEHLLQTDKSIFLNSSPSFTLSHCGFFVCVF